MMNFTYAQSIISAEQELIGCLIEQRGIQWLCHFTPRYNLESIRRFGLIPRNLLNDVQVTDHTRYDRHSNAICLSISKPNSWMFNKKQEQGLDLCLLLINPAVLYEKNCLFYPHNAATAIYRDASDEMLQGEKALERLFANEVTYQKSGRELTTIRRNGDLKKCETTSDQAEVQCLDIIEPTYIWHIIENNIPLTFNGIINYLKIALIKKNLELLFKQISS